MRPRRKRRLCFIRVVGSIGLAGVLLPASAAAVADLSLAMTATPSVGVGLALNYGIAVSNVGADPASRAAVSVKLPAGVDVVGVTASRGRCTRGRLTRCELGTLVPGAVAAVVVSVRPTAPGRLSAAARTSVSGGADANPANDFTSVLTRVTLIPGRCANMRFGTSLADVLTGTSGGDAVFGEIGNDRLIGGLGGDCLYGQRGDDRLLGRSGADRVLGGPGRDALVGGSGADRLSGGPGRDRLFGGGASDRLSGGAGADRIEGGRGSDRVRGGGGADRIAGAEVVDAGGADDTITAGGNARVRCGPGRDTVRTRGRPRLTGCERVVRLPERVALPFGGAPAPAPAPRVRGCGRRRCRRGGLPSQASGPTAYRRREGVSGAAGSRIRVR